MEAYGLTDIGMVRSMNQDFVFASPKKIGPLENLFLVADGMGGHKAGDYASRFMIRRLVRFLQKYMPGFEQAFLLREASMLGIRESYRIQGQYLLDEQDYMNRARFADGVVKGDWYMDVHAAAGKAADWKEYTPVEYYEIPYRSLVTNQAENLIVAGRCISTSFLMQASIRIQPTLTDMGQIAGEACALAKQTGTPLAKLDGARLRHF